MKKLVSYLKQKTMKREYAAILIAVLCYQIWQGNVAMVEVIIWPVLLFVAAVVGVHMANTGQGVSYGA